MFAWGAAYLVRFSPDKEVAPLVSWSLLLEHFAALALVWTWVALAGFALSPILRLRVGFAGVPLFGVVYWTLALYLMPFEGGLDLAAGLVLALSAVGVVRWWRAGALRPAWTRFSWFTLILVIGSLPYLTTLLYHYVPFGMDGSMHTTAAALIARHGGLPTSHAPFAPDLAFPPMNLGLPTVAAVAIRWGGETSAVMLACHHLTFTLLMLATYSLVRVWVQRNPAALIAVVSVWTARGSQASLEWGGFPTVTSVAIGVFAVRLLLQQCRTTNWRFALATGAAVAAIPLIHGVGGGTWLYCAGPSVTLACFLRAQTKKATLRALAITGLSAAAFLVIYRTAGVIDLQASDMEITHQWQESSVTLADPIWLSSIGYIRKDAGSFIVLAGWAALGVLAWRRQGGAVGVLALAWVSLALVVANSRDWILPASFLLYPERVLYWAAPLSAVSLALAWRSVAPVAYAPAASRLAAAGVALGLLCMAGYYHNQFYQRIVRQDFVNAEGWDALVWAKEHLRPERDYVQTRYNSTGSFLPAVALIGCTGAHHHHFLARQVTQAAAVRTITHTLVDHGLTAASVPAGDVVFQNPSITIVAITKNRLAGSVARRHDDK